MSLTTVASSLQNFEKKEFCLTHFVWRYAKDRGLTQAEVTFYCKDKVPSDNGMQPPFYALQNIFHR